MPETAPGPGGSLPTKKASKKIRLQSPRNLPDEKALCRLRFVKLCLLCLLHRSPQEVSACNTSLERRPKASSNFGKLSFGKHASPKATVYLGECLKSFTALGLSTSNCIYHTQDHQPSNAVTHVVHYCMVNLPNYS